MKGSSISSPAAYLGGWREAVPQDSGTGAHASPGWKGLRRGRFALFSRADGPRTGEVPDIVIFFVPLN